MGVNVLLLIDTFYRKKKSSQHYSVLATGMGLQGTDGETWCDQDLFNQSAALTEFDFILWLTDGTVAAMGIINTDSARMEFVANLWKRDGLTRWRENTWRREVGWLTSAGQLYNHPCAYRLTSMMSRLVSPRQTGRIQEESGKVRSGNHSAPPVARSDCSTVGKFAVSPDRGLIRVSLGQQQCKLTRLVQTQVSKGQRETDPQRQLNPDQQTGFERVTVISDVELRNDATQILLELEPENERQVSPSGAVLLPCSSHKWALWHIWVYAMRYPYICLSSVSQGHWELFETRTHL